jgi:general L-amino acid transport system permease protein
MANVEAFKALPSLAPPPSVRPNLLRDLVRTYFGSPLNVVLTLISVWLIYTMVPPFISWAFINATWTGDAQACRANGGACWSFIREKFAFSVFGLYTFEERWRPLAMLLIFATMVIVSMFKIAWRRELLYAWLLAFVAMYVLMLGGVFGLPLVETRLWGGWPVTVWISVVGLLFAFPISILLALGRRSKLPVIKYVSIFWIEFVRGVPLISILFMAAIIVPLFLPGGVSIDRLVRAQIAFTMFASAYLAEVVRGGLQAIPRGQYEAADALGLSYGKKMAFIVLPQALKITIPAQVNTFIGLFKDTTLVLVIGIFDFFTTLRAALGDQNWLGFATEAYVYAASVYFIFCFAISRYSLWLEKDLERGHR